MSLFLENIRLAMGRSTLEADCAFDGKITALFGPTGAGKTSLLEIIAGLRKCRTGKILLNGRVLQDTAQKIFLSPRQRKVGYVPQDVALFPHISVSGNMRYAVHKKQNSCVSFDLICETMDLHPLLERKPDTLSGGEKQRVAFARALLAEPDILLLDEPLSSLDYSMKQRIISYLLRIRDEFHIPMILVTHSSEEVMALCDQVIILRSGKVAHQGTPDRLFVKSEEYLYRPRE